MNVVRMSIIGNECVHCGTIITENLKCDGCGWVDPVTRKPNGEQMTDFPKKIYLQKEDGAHPDCDTYYGEGMTWCEDKLNKDDVEYIRADLVNERTRHIAEQVISKEKESEYMSTHEEKILNHILTRINELTQGE